MRTVVLFACVLLCGAENVIKTKPGGTATFNCGLIDASSTILKWYRGTDTLFTTNPKTGMPLKGKVELVKRSQLKNEKDLMISQVKNEDAGLFSCTARGQLEEHRLIVVSVSVSPPGPLVLGSEACLRCNVVGMAPDSVAVWKRPDGQRTTSHSVNLTSVAQSDAGSWECVFTVGGKDMSEALTIEVRATDPTTTSPTTLTLGIVKSSQSTSSATTTEAGLSWWIWAAGGGGCLVVVLLWVLVLVLYNRMTRRKRRFMKMRNAAQLKPNQYCQCPNPAAAPGGRREPSAPPLSPLSVKCY